MTDAWAGLASLFDGNSDHAVMQFIARTVAGELATAMLVQVKAVDAGGGALGPIGRVDVQPMVAQIDGRGQGTDHGTIHNLPYFRLQGGANAVIIDPAVGDIGLAVFASHDISTVKNTKAPGLPGSRRRFDWSDGLYFGSFLRDAPERYIRFDSAGDVWIKPATKVTVEGDLHVTGAGTFDGDVTAEGTSLHTHTHGGVQTGSGTTGAPT